MLSSFANAQSMDESLSKFLKEYDLIDIIKKLAALLTFPEYHENNYRIEFLIYQALKTCQSTKKLSGQKLNKFLNKYDSIAMMEDPSEDVFVSNVSSKFGNFRIFEGLFVSSGFYLQELIDIFEEYSCFEDESLKRSCYALLALSEYLAGKYNLERWSASQSNTAQKSIIIPKDQLLATRADLLIVSDKLLHELKLSRSSLQPFILSEDKKSQANFRQHPIIEYNNQLVLGIPSCIGIAIRLYCLKQLKEKRLLDTLELLLRKKRAEVIVNEYFIYGLDAHPISFDLPQEHDQEELLFDELVLQFDTDKYAHAIILHDRFELKQNQDIYELPEEQKLFLDKRIAEISQHIKKLKKTSNGLTILIQCGVGTGFLFATNETSETWPFFVISIAELDLLSKSKQHTLLKIWKYQSRRSKIVKKITLINPSGFLNEYAYWIQNNYSLIPLKFDYSSTNNGVLCIASDCSKNFKVQIQLDQDAHAVKTSYQGPYVKVVRLMQLPFYEEDKHRPIYVSIDALRQKVLLGVVENKACVIWVALNSIGMASEILGLVNNLWEMVLFRLDRMSSFLEENLKDLPKEPITIQLFLNNSGKWKDIEEYAQLEPAKPRHLVFAHEFKIQIILREGFLSSLSGATNYGEKSLLLVIIQALNELLASFDLSKFDDAKVENELKQIFKNSDAKHIHLFANISSISFTAYQSLYNEKPFFINPEDEADVLFGLAWTVDKTLEKGKIKEIKKCIEVLNNTVLHLFEKINASLATLDTKTLIAELLKNIEAIELEFENTHNTSKSALAMHSDRNDVVIREFKEESKRVCTSLACESVHRTVSVS